jgi:hypothetical protein
VHQVGVRAPVVLRAFVLSLVLSAAVALSPVRTADAHLRSSHARRDSISRRDSELTAIPDSIFGFSGKLRFRSFAAWRPMQVPILAKMFGDAALNVPGVYTTFAETVGRPFSLLNLLPFGLKSGGRVGDYRVGFWPAEKRHARSDAYENPDGFIVVTPETQDTPVSEHFRLRDFLTHDQRDVWPKYLVLREELVDKLELLIDELESSGVRVTHISVLSGFRTPQYNQLGVGRGGRAPESRHQYGDAADIFIDNNGDGRLDDLNHDGRVNSKDVRVLIQAIERVENAHPSLVGGLGLYRATRSHGPFVHVDVRGQRARWGRA